MAKLPRDVSGREMLAALEYAGFVFRRQKGSHMVVRRDNPYARVIIPDHKQLRTGTLHQIMSDAGLTLEELIDLLDR